MHMLPKLLLQGGQLQVFVVQLPLEDGGGLSKGSLQFPTAGMLGACPQPQLLNSPYQLPCNHTPLLLLVTITNENTPHTSVWSFSCSVWVQKEKSCQREKASQDQKRVTCRQRQLRPQKATAKVNLRPMNLLLVHTAPEPEPSQPLHRYYKPKYKLKCRLSCHAGLACVKHNKLKVIVLIICISWRQQLINSSSSTSPFFSLGFFSSHVEEAVSQGPKLGLHPCLPPGRRCFPSCHLLPTLHQLLFCNQNFGINEKL